MNTVKFCMYVGKILIGCKVKMYVNNEGCDSSKSVA